MGAMVERNLDNKQEQSEAGKSRGKIVVIPGETWEYCKAKAHEINSRTKPEDEYNKIFNDGLILNMLLDQNVVITVRTPNGGVKSMQNVLDEVTEKRMKRACERSTEST